jgi:hypothetical protein
MLHTAVLLQYINLVCRHRFYESMNKVEGMGFEPKRAGHVFIFRVFSDGHDIPLLYKDVIYKINNCPLVSNPTLRTVSEDLSPHL